jgi:hypothetical protein
MTLFQYVMPRVWLVRPSLIIISLQKNSRELVKISAAPDAYHNWRAMISPMGSSNRVVGFHGNVLNDTQLGKPPKIE